MKFHIKKNGGKQAVCGKDISDSKLLVSAKDFVVILKEKKSLCCSNCESTMVLNYPIKSEQVGLKASGQTIIDPNDLYERSTRPILMKFAKMNPKAQRAVIVIQPSTNQSNGFKFMLVAMIAGGSLTETSHHPEMNDVDKKVEEWLTFFKKNFNIPKGEVVIRKIFQ